MSHGCGEASTADAVCCTFPPAPLGDRSKKNKAFLNELEIKKIRINELFNVKFYQYNLYNLYLNINKHC